MEASTVNGNDIIHLNVGGQKLTTKRSTLCQVENSLLATMFSGRWEESLERDQDGVVFLDYNPQYFVLILDYLRATKIAAPGTRIPWPKVADDQSKYFNILLQYLGLSPKEYVGQHSSGVIVQESETVAVKGPDRTPANIVGENVYQHGIVKVRLKIESFQNNPHWIFVGMVKEDVAPPNNYSYRCYGSYGWQLGRCGQIWKCGINTAETTLNNVTKQGDTVDLVLDCEAAKLSLHLANSQQFHIEIPKSQTWRLIVNLLGSNDKIRIINE